MSHRYSGPSGRLSVTLGIAAWALTSCTTLGTNIKGSFSCRAPEGTCAPTSRIDDQVLAMLQGDPATPSPAGPYLPSASRPSVIQASASQSLRRSGEKVVRIVFPAFVDGAGRYHEASAIHAVVDQGAWVDAELPGRGPGVAVQSSGPSLGELASAAPEMAFNRTEVASSAAPAATALTTSVPTKAQVDAARGQHRAAAGIAPSVAVIRGSGSPVLAAATARPVPMASVSDVRGQVQARLATMKPVLLAKDQRRPVNAPSVLPVGSVEQ